MKRFFTLFTTVVVFLYAHAQEHVYYLLPNSYDWNCEGVTSVFDNNSGGSHNGQNQLQWEDFEWTKDNHDYSPERRAYAWFRENYCTGIADSKEGVRHVITYKDLTDDRLEANGDLFSTVKVLWVNVDRNMDTTSFNALFPSDIRSKLANFVKAGGNLYLSTFASRLVWLMNRMNAKPGFEENNGIDGNSADWYVRAHFDSQDNHGHAVYKYMSDYNSTSGNFPMLSGTNHTNRNCLWTENYSAFQTSHTCKVLGSWGHDSDRSFQSDGLVEFYPTGDWKGTIICNGLAACSFAPTNTNKSKVENLTKGILDYLSTPVSLSISVKENPVIKDEENITVNKSDNLTIISYASTNSDIADIHNVEEVDAGKIFYNYFGEVTLTVSAQGDGKTAPKNIVTASVTRIVTGGEPAQYAYVLPYSMRTISDVNYDGNTSSGNIPDFLSALWFYEHYVKKNRSDVDNYGEGCFINPKNYSSSPAIPADIQVLWVHNDHVGQVSDTYRNDLGGDNFVAALQAFINRGGNVFLSKQATRLLGDLGRLGSAVYPSYNNGGYDAFNCDDCDWGIKNSFFTGDDIVDYSTHSVYTTPNDLGENPGLIDAANHAWRTNNNDILFDDKVNNTLESFNTYQADHNCKLLGSWNNSGTDYQAGVFAEFLPQSAGQGTIIMLGAAAYQWTCGTQTAALDHVNENVPKITQNILHYLSTATVVVTEPDTDIPSTVNDLVVYQGGSVSNTEDITINNSITYVYDASGDGATKLGQWYTFCLPFNPSEVKVKTYNIKSVYLTGNDADPNEPEGAGSFYLKTFSSYDEESNAKWSYIGNPGMPTKDTPYIIKFLDSSENNDLATYFTTNNEIKFIGGAQTISGTHSETEGEATCDFTFHVNKTLRKLELTNIYPLNTVSNAFEYDYGETSTIMPFECYIKASSPSIANACPRIMIGRRTPEQNNTATSIENLTADNNSPVLVYDLMGRLCYETLPASLPQGMWIIRQGQTTRTIVIP